jgi:hypothetical protein
MDGRSDSDIPVFGCMPQYFQMDYKFFQQRRGIATGSFLPLLVGDIFMKRFEKLVLDLTRFLPSLWLRYFDSIFVVWPYGPERL